MNTQPIPTFRVLGRKHPLDQDTLVAYAPHGTSVRDIIGGGDSYFIALDDREIPAVEWADLRPPPDSTLHIVPIPQDDSVKQLLLTAGLIAAAVFAAPALPTLGLSTSAATALWQGSIMAVGSLALTALVKPAETVE